MAEELHNIQCSCGHWMSEHTFWNGCTYGTCKCQNDQQTILKEAYGNLKKEYDKLIQENNK